jgi:hypothetical protein
VRTLLNDIETFKTQFLICLEDADTGERLSFEVRGEGPLDFERLERVMLGCRHITYNGTAFDMPIIFKMIQLARKNDGIVKSIWAWELAQQIIGGRLRYWEVPDALGVEIPRRLEHIDLIEPQPNPWASLKVLNGRLHGKWMQDLPFAPDADLTDEQMDVNVEYCWNDIAATKLLFTSLSGPLELRAALSDIYGEDFRSKSDSQMGERIIRKAVQDKLGKKVERIETKPGTVFRYEPPEYIKFSNPQLNEILERLKGERFVLNEQSKVDLPKWIKDERITIGSSTFTMGLGGLHSTEKNRSIHSDEDFVLLDADVGGYYSALIINANLYPQSCGPAFITAFSGIRTDRMTAKKKGDKVRDKGLKVASLGCFGKLGSPYSILFAPHLLIATTLTGQLALLMLIDDADQAGIDATSGNTDGVVFKCPRDEHHGTDGVRLVGGLLKRVCDEWEARTGFDLEFNEYRSLFNQSVNSYFAVKPDGKVKQKGPYADWWTYDPDLREQMMHNPSASICGRAVIEKLVNNTPVEDTIRDSRDIREFVTVVAATGGATWRDQYLGKVVRYYWGLDGDPIIKVKPNAKGTLNKVPRTDGSRPLMTLPDDLPGDIDYPRYAEEADKILREIGYYEAKPKPMSKRRRKFSLPVALAWAVAV